MVGAEVPRLVVSKILNHVDSGVTAVYDRHSYDAENRAALEVWGRHVEAIVRGERNSKGVTFAARPYAPSTVAALRPARGVAPLM